jgi:hypothetical protein
MVFPVPRWPRIGGLIGTPPRPWQVAAAFGATDAELVRLALADTPQDPRIQWDHLGFLSGPRLP